MPGEVWDHVLSVGTVCLVAVTDIADLFVALCVPGVRFLVDCDLAAGGEQ